MSAPVLVVDRGDMPSLTACAIQADPSRCVLWHLVEPDLAAPRRCEAVEAHAEAWGIQNVVTSKPGDFGIPGMAPPPDLLLSSILLNAVTVARQVGCRKIVWPHQVGPRGTEVAIAVDRANTVAALADLGGEAATVAIELPLVDLDDQQLVELVEETGAPLRAFWPCLGGDPRPCRKCTECQRWQEAFEALRQPWPWDAAPV
jgi:hypothetical protein